MNKEKQKSYLVPLSIIIAGVLIAITIFAGQRSPGTEIIRDLEEEMYNEEIPKEEAVALKIERCKAEAEFYADNRAREAYMEAFKKAVDEGDTQSAQIYLEASYEPKRPHDWSTNYQEAYIYCLNE